MKPLSFVAVTVTAVLAFTSAESQTIRYRDTTRIIQYADSMSFTKAARFRSYVQIDSGPVPTNAANGARLYVWGSGDKLYWKSSANVNYDLTLGSTLTPTFTTITIDPATAGTSTTIINNGGPDITTNGDIYPTANAAQNIGSSTTAWNWVKAKRLYADNSTSFTDRNSLVTANSTDTTTRTTVKYLYYGLSTSRGDSGLNFAGSGGAYYKIYEDTTRGIAQGTISRKRGVLVGTTIDLYPLTENTPYTANRDATGIIIDNNGTVQATEAIYIGGSAHKVATGANPLGYDWTHQVALGDTAAAGIKFLPEGANNIMIDMSVGNTIGSNPRAIKTTSTIQSDLGTLTLGGATLDSALSITGGANLSRGLKVGGRIGVNMNPTYPVDITASSTDVQALRAAAGRTAGNSNAIQGVATATNSGENRAFYADAANGSNNYSFYGNTGTFLNLGQSLFAITSGNVGIGDQTPAALLTVGSGDLFQVSSAGKVASVLGVATQGNTGVPTVVIDSVRTGQSAAISASTIYAVPASGAGRYRISWSATITTAATTSSTLGGSGGFQVVYTDNTDNVVKTTVTGNSVTSTANTTGTAISGVLIANCKASTNLQYQFGYTSSGATAMVYDLTVLVEKF